MSTVMIVLLFGLTMMAIERWRPGRHFEKRQGWWYRATFLNLMQAISVLIGTLTWDRWLPGHSLTPGMHWSLPVQITCGYLLITFVYYWWHRARHEIPVLWRWFHQLHHSPARIEIITSFYKHPLEILCNGFLSSFLLYVVLGLSVHAVTTVILVTGIAELFYHWNVRTPYWLGFFFQRPESHCIHHHAGYHRNNYSDLPLWDMLFGTFENPRHQPEKCGFDNTCETKLLPMLMGHDIHREAAKARKEALS